MKSPTIVCCGLLLAGCGTFQDDPIIDTRGVNLARYNADLAECEAYAAQVPGAQKTATGAAAGAVVGGAVGAAVGDSQTAQRGAGVGAIGGAMRGANDARSDRERVLRNCLIGRGYRVLN